jgi:hypothetical protein
MADKADEDIKSSSKEAKVTETINKKDNDKTVKKSATIDNKKYNLGSAQIILGVLAIALVAGMIGYGASRHNDDRFGLFSTRTMMGERGFQTDGNFDSYSSAGGTTMMGQNGGMMRSGYHGSIGSVDSVNETQIVIKPIQGGLVTFKIDNNTKVYNGTTEAKVSDLKSGQNVMVQPDQSDSTKAYKITIN